jgi:hypothetical protein
MPGEPIILRDLRGIAKGGWGRQVIVYEGICTYGSEISSMDNVLELSPHAGMIESGTVPPISSSGRIVERAHVTGFLLAKPGRIVWPLRISSGGTVGHEHRAPRNAIRVTESVHRALNHPLNHGTRVVNNGFFGR